MFRKPSFPYDSNILNVVRWQQTLCGEWQGFAHFFSVSANLRVYILALMCEDLFWLSQVSFHTCLLTHLSICYCYRQQRILDRNWWRHPWPWPIASERWTAQKWVNSFYCFCFKRYWFALFFIRALDFIVLLWIQLLIWSPFPFLIS